MNRLRVLMITGGYYPDIAGGILQCQEIVQSLRDRVSFAVLTMAANPALAEVDRVDGIDVYRVLVDVERRRSKASAALRLARRFIGLASRFDIVHIHGFSQRAILLIPLAHMLRKRVILTLQTGGHDDAVQIRSRSRLAFRAFAQPDLITAVSPDLRDACRAAGLPDTKCRFIPNAVDLVRFRPAAPLDRATLRRDLDLPVQGPLILFVAAFFTPEKCPDVLFDAWLRLPEPLLASSTLVLIGKSESPYFEADAELARMLRARADAAGRGGQLRLVERAGAIEQYFRAADIFVLPSVREGMPKTVLEAMASGLPCIATNLPGATDVLIQTWVNGVLVPPRDTTALADVLRTLLEQPERARALGVAARRSAEDTYDSARIMPQYLDAYRALMGAPERAPEPAMGTPRP